MTLQKTTKLILITLNIALTNSVLAESFEADKATIQLPMQTEFTGLKKDIPIGTVGDTMLTIDIAIPSKTSDTPRAAIVMIHGGGFVKGNKSRFSNMLMRSEESLQRA